MWRACVLFKHIIDDVIYGALVALSKNVTYENVIKIKSKSTGLGILLK